MKHTTDNVIDVACFAEKQAVSDIPNAPWSLWVCACGERILAIAAYKQPSTHNACIIYAWVYVTLIYVTGYFSPSVETNVDDSIAMNAVSAHDSGFNRSGFSRCFITTCLFGMHLVFF